MPPLVGSLPCSLIRHSSSLLSKTLIPFFFNLHHRRRHASSLSFRPQSSLKPHLKHHRRPMTTQNPNPNPNPSSRSSKNSRRHDPDAVLRHKIGICSRNQDPAEALRLFETARRDSIPLFLPHYNSLLYLCSLSPSQSSRGYEIYDQLLLDKIEPNEATFTSLARLAANDKNPRRAFEFVKQMMAAAIPPKLRSYGPALFGFCEIGDFESAREVELHMDENGVLPEEDELRALLKVSAGTKRGDEVYRILHRLRSLVRRVGEETVEAVEEWFGSETAEGAGKEKWDDGEVKEGVVKGGGGWHGIGWLGKGRWSVGRSEMDGDGVCRRCGERLVCIDIDPVETEEFGRKLANLACEREAKADFTGFQVWLHELLMFVFVILNTGLLRDWKCFRS